MKYLLMLCLALSLGGCAGKKVPEPPQPVNGWCDTVQDACLLGDPSSTGETSPPYGWMCLGRYGGENDICSVPTARIERDEVFAGQNALEEKVRTEGLLWGLLTILDWTRNSDDPSHANAMERTALNMGVPQENIAVLGEDKLFLSSDKWRNLREKTRVAALPTAWAAFPVLEEVPFIRQNNILFVASAGNTDSVGSGSRDLWYPDHPWWGGNLSSFREAMEKFSTGKVILATYVDKTPEGKVVPYDEVVRCGMAKEFCYSVIQPNSNTPARSGDGSGTSAASVQLGALTFYLFQLWDTPQEVVNVLNVCAEDVGVPGIDEEYGRGIVSVVCDTVQNRERKAVVSSMQVSNWSSPVMAEMTGEYDRHLVPQSLSPRSSPARFRPFYRVRGNDTKSFTGHLGGRFSLRGTNLFVSGGTAYSPLGIHSPLRSSTRTPFMEFGAGRSLFSRNGHSVLLLGTYGYGEGGNLSAHAGRLGVRYDRHFGPAVLSLRALYRRVQGHLGIPGHREAGVDSVPFADDTPEVFLSFSLGG